MQKKHRILLLGGSGQLGHRLRDHLRSLGELIVPGRDTLDLRNLSEVQQEVRRLRPSLIVNAAAYTAVDRAEQESDLAHLVNGKAPAVLAEEATRLDAVLIHYSTDYVFDGTSDSPYTEDGTPNPINCYGRSKLAGDRAIQDVGGRFLIFRTSWVYSINRSNFVSTIVEQARRGERLKVVEDQVGCPTSAGWLARSTCKILEQVLGGKDAWGLYNLASGGRASWYVFASKIVSTLDVPDTQIEPISTEQLELAAPRPRYTVLSKEKVMDTFKLGISSWDAQCDTVLSDG